MSLYLLIGLLGVVLVLMGVLFLVLAWRGRQRTELAAQTLARATARVVKVKVIEDGSDARLRRAYPVLEFTTAAGERTVVTSRHPNSSGLSRQVGDTVEVQYDPNDPKHADTPAPEAGFLVMTLAGAIVALLGAIILTAAIRG